MTIAHLSNFWLILIFILSSVTIWIAGSRISITTDIIDTHFNMGEALGGIIFLAVVTNLPEIAITCTAAYNGHLEIAASNILGGIAIQTVVLALVDAFGVGRSAPLTYKASSVELIVEGIVLIFILNLVLIGYYLPKTFIFFRVTPIELAIVATWIFGIYLVSKKITLPTFVHNSPNLIEETVPKKEKNTKKQPLRPAIIMFSIGAFLTLGAGWILEISSEVLAERMGINGAIFGATILAAATALPEISTGIASAKMKNYQMAMSDIIGGNAFLPVLFIIGSLISGKAILPDLLPSDMYLTGLGILLTIIYLIGLILRLTKQRFNMGIDSIVVVIVYVLGIVGLFYIG
ncbi:MAG TPA: hypothetical protein VK766_10850 [Cytophagaceae bacterium]|jgi:cation:H+ antiporter|nr:hypothetical protein [Cytophagaceae bacterium]